MKDFTTMTPREYSAARRSLPFGTYMLQASGNPDWRKIGRGMIAAVDGSTYADDLPWQGLCNRDP